MSENISIIDEIRSVAWNLSNVSEKLPTDSEYFLFINPVMERQLHQEVKDKTTLIGETELGENGCIKFFRTFGINFKLIVSEYIEKVVVGFSGSI